MRRRLRAAARLPVLAAVLAVTAGCQLDVQVRLAVGDDGAGEVEVAAALDEAAAARVPLLADQLEVDDLVATGWRVEGPSTEGDDRTWVRASKPFASAEDAAAVLDEVSGPDGPFGDLAVRREPSLLRDRWHVVGTVDLTGGIAAFSDEGLRARLDGTDVGLSDEELVAAAGRPVAEALTFSVAVVLPGDVTSNGSAGAGADDARWRPVLGEAVPIEATGRRVHTVTAALLALAAAAGVALVAVLVGRALRRGGPHGRRRSAVGTVGR